MRQGTLCAVLKQSQFIIAHAPTTCKVLPVFDSAVVGIQFEPQGVQKIFVVHEVTDLGSRCGAVALTIRAVK